MPRIVIAFDGSPSARTAVARAAELLPGADATVLVVTPGTGALRAASGGARTALPDEVIATALDRLHASALAEAEELAAAGVEAASRAGLNAAPAVLAGEGAVWATVLDAADGAEAIVCGTRGHGAAVRALLGSVAAGLVHHAGVPVLVVPEEAPAASGPVLLAFDGSPSAERAVAAVARVLPGRDAVVVHAWRSLVRNTLTGRALRGAPLPEIREGADEVDAMFAEQAEMDTARGVALAEQHGLGARGRTEESADAPAQVLLRVADEEDAAVVAVGRRGRGATAEAVLGSVSASLLHTADRPLLIANA